MDHRSFDRLARLLGEATDRRAGLKAAFGALLGAGGAAAALEMDVEAKKRGKGKDADRKVVAGPDADKRKKRKKTCKPACTAGFECAKVGKKRECVCASGVTCGESCCELGQSCVEGQCRAAACDPACGSGYVCDGTACVCPSSVECGTACCASGQTCENGTCAGGPDPDTCIAAGQPCKAAGRACCGGRVCSSGQGGERDIACYVPKTGRCAASGDCVYGTTCVDGRCAPLPPAPGPAPTPVSTLGAACSPQTNVCTAPGAVCSAYTGDHPVGLSGSYCTLPLGMTCTGDPECTCYSCGYPEGSFRVGRSRRQARAARPKVCCGPAGFPCGKDGDCCEDNVCSSGFCTPKTGCTVCKTGSCLYATIEEAITAGVRDIRVGTGVYKEHDLPAPAGANLRIRPCGAANVVIDAEQLGRIMEPIPSGTTVTIQGITLRNGEVSGNGGALDVQAGGTLVVVDAIVSTCTANASNARGGGIHVSGGTLTMTRATLTGNRAPNGDESSGGGVYLSAGARSTLTDCVIDRNYSYGYGGGLTIGANSAAVDVIGGSITNNDILYWRGGGVHVNTLGSADTKTTFDSVWIAGNTLSGGDNNGVGVNITTGHVDFTGTTRIENNSSTFDSDGGGLSMHNGTVTLGKDTVVVGNSVTADGGGIAVYAGTLTVEGTIFDNTAGADGGGIFNDRGKVTVRGDAEITGNTAGGGNGGGGIYNYDGEFTVTGDAVITMNTATNGYGGGIYNYRKLFVEGSVSVLENMAPAKSGTGVGIYNDFDSTVQCTVTANPPVVCSNPTNGSTGKTNCDGGGTFTDCDSVCVGVPKNTTNSGACPPA